MGLALTSPPLLTQHPFRRLNEDLLENSKAEIAALPCALPLPANVVVRQFGRFVDGFKLAVVEQSETVFAGGQCRTEFEYSILRPIPGSAR